MFAKPPGKDSNWAGLEAHPWVSAVMAGHGNAGAFPGGKAGALTAELGRGRGGQGSVLGDKTTHVAHAGLPFQVPSWTMCSLLLNFPSKCPVVTIFHSHERTGKSVQSTRHGPLPSIN